MAIAKVIQETKREIADRELGKIITKHGELTPELILKEARSATHPLHSFFEWNDKIAGLKYRIEQAAEMIRASKYVEILQSSREAENVIKLPSEREHSKLRAYLPTYQGRVFLERVTVLSDKEMREAFVVRKLLELRAWCDSVSDVKELASIRRKILADLEGDAKAPKHLSTK